MKQRGVGEHAVEIFFRQLELEEILLPYFAAAMGACHRCKMHGAFQTDSDVTLFRKHLEVAPWSAAKVEYRKWRLGMDMLQQCLNVLADVVIARAFPEFFGTLIVVLKRTMGEFFQVLRMQFHIHPTRTNCMSSTCSMGSALVETHPIDRSSSVEYWRCCSWLQRSKEMALAC